MPTSAVVVASAGCVPRTEICTLLPLLLTCARRQAENQPSCEAGMGPFNHSGANPRLPFQVCVAPVASVKVTT